MRDASETLRLIFMDRCLTIASMGNCFLAWDSRPTRGRAQSNFLFQRKNMFTLIREIGLRGRLRKEAPYLVSAFLIDECFYKFHSFTLACGDFLATWFLFSAAALDHEADSASARWQILMRVPASKTRPITTETAN